MATPLQCSCLENPRDGGAWLAAVYGVTQSQTRLKQLSSSSESNFNDILFNPMYHKLSLKHVINLKLIKNHIHIYIHTYICVYDAKTWNLVCIFYQEHISIGINHIL